MRRVGQEGHQSNNPKRQFFILNLQDQKLNQIRLHDIIVTKKKSRMRIHWVVMSNELHKIFDGFFTMRSFDIGFKRSIIFEDGLYST